MYTLELNQLRRWFHTDHPDELRDTCRIFLEPMALTSADPLLEQLEAVDTNWSVVLAELRHLFPEPPALREALMRYLSGVLAFMKKAGDPCDEWLHSSHHSYLMIDSPAEQAAFLNLFLTQPLPESPTAWLNAAPTPLSDWLPLQLLAGGSEELTSLATLLIAGAQLVENQQLQSDLDYLVRQPCIQRFGNLHDQVEQDIYQDLQQQCDSLASLGLNPDQVGHYYTQVRLFFSTRPVFTTWQEADHALKILLEVGDPCLFIVPASYRQQLLNKALIQLPHHGAELALCPNTDLPLWQDEKKQWQTVSRDPVVRQGVATGVLQPIMDKAYVGLKDYYQLHHQVIRDWYLPGRLELDIANAARAAGWTVTLWPRRDQIDVLCEHPKAGLALAIDGKDWSNGYLLGRNFSGFKSYADPTRYLGLVVVPDYQLIQPKYREQFFGGQAYQGHQARLLDVTGFRQLVKQPTAIVAFSSQHSLESETSGDKK